MAPARVEAVGDLPTALRTLAILRAWLMVVALLTTPLVARDASGIRSIAPRTASPSAPSSLPNLVAEASSSWIAKGLSPKRKPSSRYSLIFVSRKISNSGTDMSPAIARANSALTELGLKVSCSKAPIGKLRRM